MDHEWEEHPSFGAIQVNRVSASPPGQSLFDSDVQHQHYVVVKIMHAERTRDLHRDWMMPRQEILEIAMSEAQWASFLSSTNSSAVPCTLQSMNNQRIEGLPFAPRLEQSMKETRAAAHEAFDEIKEALAEYEAHKTVGNLRTLRSKVENAVANVDFAGKSLTEHAENVVQKARADIEAMVARAQSQKELEASDVAPKLLEQ